MKSRLLSPGPTPVPEETLLELARPVIHHRSPEFRAILAEVLADLRTVYVTRCPVVPLACSGTGGLEAALVSSVASGGKAICLVAGKFGERWTHIARAHGIEPITLRAPLGQAVQPDQLAQALKDHPDAAAVCATHSETSTGVGHDIQAFGRLVAKTPALLLVDSISSLGAMECRTDDWHIDLNVTGSQKALMLPPGLAFVSVSDKAAAVLAKHPPRNFYFDLKKAYDKIKDTDTPYTPAHTLLRGMRLSLKRLLANGIEAVWAEQARNAAAARAGFMAVGLELFPSPPNNALTAVSVPAGIDGNDLLKRLEKQYGLKLANGQDSLKGKIIRLAHMGYVDMFDILAALAGVELVLGQMGHPVEPGASVTAAQRVYAQP